jgi:uncharacterized protein (DUF427 family)
MSTSLIVVVFNGRELVRTNRSARVLETSHPPTYYIPLDEIRREMLRYNPQQSYCEWKGKAEYWDVVDGGQRAEMAGWSYPDPTERFREIKDWVAFYAHKMDACYVDDEKVNPQEGTFYGGWVTSKVVGPFKGAPGTLGW